MGYVFGGNMEIQKVLKADLDAVTRLVSEVSAKRCVRKSSTCLEVKLFGCFLS
jgi:hypothetical protein